jgi:hypothetical protein
VTEKSSAVFLIGTPFAVGPQYQNQRTGETHQRPLSTSTLSGRPAATNCGSAV